VKKGKRGDGKKEREREREKKLTRKEASAGERRMKTPARRERRGEKNEADPRNRNAIKGETMEE